MEEWKLQWLDPIDGRGVLRNDRIPEERAGIYVWVHKPTNQVIYIGQSERIYSRVCEEAQLLINGEWNIYDFESEPDFSEILRKYSFPLEHPAKVNETKMIFIPNQNNSKQIFDKYWRCRIEKYLQNLRFFFCTGEWSSEQKNRAALEATLLRGYKKFYAKKAGISNFEKDNNRISIGKMDRSNLSGKVRFIHQGNTEKLPQIVKEIAESNSLINFQFQLQELVNQFVDAVGYGNELRVSEPYYPYEHPNDDEPYPNAGYPGCYVFASKNADVKYVGKASRYLGNRIWAHIGRAGSPEKDGELYPNAESWLKQDQHNIGVWTVPVPDQHWWLASALEGFLVESLFPDKSRQI